MLINDNDGNANNVGSMGHFKSDHRILIYTYEKIAVQTSTSHHVVKPNPIGLNADI